MGKHHAQLLGVLQRAGQPRHRRELRGRSVPERRHPDAQWREPDHGAEHHFGAVGAVVLLRAAQLRLRRRQVPGERRDPARRLVALRRRESLGRVPLGVRRLAPERRVVLQAPSRGSTTSSSAPSYGQTGNNDIGNYDYIGRINGGSANDYVLNNALATGRALGTLGNADLGWEKTSEVDVGLDLAMFNNRISFTADAYNGITKDLLLNVEVPQSSGFATVTRNTGRVRNRGVELGAAHGQRAARLVPVVERLQRRDEPQHGARAGRQRCAHPERRERRADAHAHHDGRPARRHVLRLRVPGAVPDRRGGARRPVTRARSPAT